MNGLDAIRARAHLRDELVRAVNGNPITADDAWSLIHAWDALCDIAEQALGGLLQGEASDARSAGMESSADQR